MANFEGFSFVISSHIKPLISCKMLYFLKLGRIQKKKNKFNSSLLTSCRKYNYCLKYQMQQKQLLQKEAVKPENPK